MIFLATPGNRAAVAAAVGKPLGAALCDSTGAVVYWMSPIMEPVTEQVVDAGVQAGAVLVEEMGQLPSGLTIQGPENNAAQMRAKLGTGLAANVTFLSVANPTAAQVATQVKSLTRQMNALMKVVLNQVDDTVGV